MFIPAAVVLRARELARVFSFSTVLRSLEREGNGAWPRKTLLRRVRSTSRSATPARGQNSDQVGRLQVRRRAARAVAKTSPASRWAALEAAVAAAEYDTPAYHAAVAALHGSADHPAGAGACGCYSCTLPRRRAA